LLSISLCVITQTIADVRSKLACMVHTG